MPDRVFSQSGPSLDPEALRREAREGLPFLIIVTVVIVGIVGIGLYNNPSLREPGRLLLLIGLAALHLILYLMLFASSGLLRWSIVYMVLQTFLALGLSLLIDIPALSFGLYAALIGLAVGVLTDRRIATAAIAVLLALALLTTAWLEGWSTWFQSWTAITGWLSIVLPATAFVIVYVVLYSRQAAAKAEAESLLRELEEAHRQLAQYAIQVEDLTLAAERQRMARELHDTLAQGLAGLILQLEATKSHLEKDGTRRAREIVDQALDRARATLADARRAIGDLRDAPARSRDLGETLRQEVERFNSATGIPCAMDIALPTELPVPVNDHAPRVVSEALSNVARHAQASQVWVKAQVQDQWVEIEVRDDGVGFDPHRRAAEETGHYGLLGMRERARLAGGRVNITSAPGRGAAVRLTLPIT